MNGSSALSFEETRALSSVSVFNVDLLSLPVESVAEKIIERLKENYSATQTHIILHKLQEILDVAKDANKEDALLGLTKGETFLGYSAQERKLPSKYEYDSPTLTHMEDAVKAMKKMLQSLTQEMVDPATGELLKPAKKIEGGATIAVVKAKA